MGIRIDSDDVIWGRILWLPREDELPEGAVKRAHGKRKLDKGVYDHPVVIASRPKDDDRMAHFHPMTSFNNKDLIDIYPGKTKHQKSAREWFLPIKPYPSSTLTHPDAISDKTKRRFPTLEVGGEKNLKRTSWVDINDVYKIDWSLLRPYTFPDSPDTDFSLRLNEYSREQMRDKAKILTHYSSEQYESGSKSIRDANQTKVEDEYTEGLEAGPASSVGEDKYGLNSPSQSDFHLSRIEDAEIFRFRLKAPPDRDTKRPFTLAVPESRRRPIARMFTSIQSPKQPTSGRPSMVSLDRNIVAGSMNRLWRDAKGVTAVVIASI
ncbi:hypothetical protein IQ07DRAFT_83576 [Pyrenochaeta sp. DS3sAY3a]|nr:hypothetical protein IQ07DRAFT_83576 [Pyrenochaeta sp. DS3sAY3a]